MLFSTRSTSLLGHTEPGDSLSFGSESGVMVIPCCLGSLLIHNFVVATMYRRDALSDRVSVRDIPQGPQSLHRHITSLMQWYLMIGKCQQILIIISSCHVVFSPCYEPHHHLSCGPSCAVGQGCSQFSSEKLPSSYHH